MDQKIRSPRLPSLEAAVGRSYRLEEHTGTTGLSLGVHTTPTPPIFQKCAPPQACACLWNLGPEDCTLGRTELTSSGCSPLQFLRSQAREKPAGQEQEKRPGALPQVWEQGLGPPEHSSLSGWET